MTKVLVATEKPFAAEAVQNIRKIIAEAGMEFALLEKYSEVSEFLSAVADADALIVRSDLVTSEVIQAAPRLKIVVRAGAGYDNIDLKAATEKSMVVMNPPGQNSNAVAELAFGMMIYMARNGFNGKIGTELSGKKLGLHGYGYVGKRIAAIAKGFGMILYGFDPFLTADAIERDGVIRSSSVEDLYATCSYVALAIPANAETKGMVNASLLLKMPKPAILVNTARKELINEKELLQVMEQRADFIYLSDVEPDCKAEIAEKFPGRFLFTAKKMGAQTSEANNNAGVAAANQIVNFFKKGDTTFQVNR